MKSKKIFVLSLLLVFILVTLTMVNVVSGNDISSEEAIICSSMGGVYVAAENKCYNAWAPTEICPDGYATINFGFVPLHGQDFSLSREALPYVCGYVNLNGSLEKEGRCKFFSVEDGYVGGTVGASGLGSVSILRLVNSEHVYKLPVIESSIVRDDVTGQWTAEFATIDPTTGQPLVSVGTYDVSCFGANGTASGAGMKVNITR
jgi:hypothetical protein